MPFQSIPMFQSIFQPIPNESSIVPDQTVTFMLFDRVVSVRQGYTVPFGLRGTIVGIHKAEKEADTMFEVVFDEAFIGGIIIRYFTSSFHTC